MIEPGVSISCATTTSKSTSVKTGLITPLRRPSVERRTAESVEPIGVTTKQVLERIAFFEPAFLAVTTRKYTTSLRV